MIDVRLGVSWPESHTGFSRAEFKLRPGERWLKQPGPSPKVQTAHCGHMVWLTVLYKVHFDEVNKSSKKIGRGKEENILSVGKEAQERKGLK